MSISEMARSDIARKSAGDSNPDPSIAGAVVSKSSAVGMKDAPVDGKDGRPHEGPFVETAAERDRKKAKEIGGEDTPTTMKKPGPKEITKGSSFAEGWDKEIPKSNDGVMDDPLREGPKEGTRGTEGGISEKSRGAKGQEGKAGSKTEKTPDAPKEVPPLPHSEQEKLMSIDGKTVQRTDKSDTGDSDDKTTKELGGLEVSLVCSERPTSNSYHPQS